MLNFTLILFTKLPRFQIFLQVFKIIKKKKL
jgi:hypothetical protein